MIMDQQTKTILCWHTQNHKELINNSCPRAMLITIKSIRPQIQQWVYVITSCFENKLWRQFCSPFCIQYKMIGLCSILIKLMEKKTYIHTYVYERTYYHNCYLFMILFTIQHWRSSFSCLSSWVCAVVSQIRR